MSSLKAGAAKVIITPPVGTIMSGYAGRPSGCTGIHDDLYARALAFDDGAEKAAIAVCDTVGFHHTSVARIRREASERSGIPAGNIMVGCTHTHSGPATMSLRACGAQDWDVTEDIEVKTVEAIVKAVEHLQTANLSVAYNKTDISVNRRQRTDNNSIDLGVNQDGACDSEVCILKVDDIEGNCLAILVNHGCHAVVMGNDNLQISADFPGAVVRSLEESLCWVGIFAQGCCGDINPRLRGTFDAVEETGRKLAKDAMAVLHNARKTNGRIRTASEILELPTFPLVSREEAEKVLVEQEAWLKENAANPPSLGAVHVAEAYRDWAKSIIEHHVAGSWMTSITAEVQAIGIGDLYFVGLPGEIFCQIGLQIKNSIAGAFVLGYTNGNIGYVFTAEAFEQGGYEVNCADRLYGDLKLRPEAEKALVDAAIRVVDSIR